MQKRFPENCYVIRQFSAKVRGQILNVGPIWAVLAPTANWAKQWPNVRYCARLRY